MVDSPSGIGANEAFDKSLDDDQPSSKPQGWLKWLSRGMLGAEGTYDSSQFFGVVSDEIIKDIYEATKFHTTPSPILDTARSDGIIMSSIKFSIHQISAMLRNRKFHRAIDELTFEGIFVECMIWEESTIVIASVNDVESKEHFHEVRKPSLNIHTYIPKANSEGELQVKVLLEPIEVTCDLTFFFNIMELHTVLSSFESHEERVLKSLNGITNVKSRIISKAEYILSSRVRTMWDISLINVKITIPWENGMSE
ncbi:hypothetical protein Tco_1415955 [Tanacetum coccineum]